jgi:putative ABC transport system ATP-binding protein
MLTVENITKEFVMGENIIHALDGVSFTIQEGEMLAIMGPSGSGKSTLMSILGCLDVPTKGKYILDGEAVEKLNDNQLADIRNRKIGFVFQQFNLLARTSAYDNVMLPLTYSSNGKNKREIVRNALEKVGLGDRMGHTPSELSGGQQQRVAIARALVNNPAILMADEPTGALDSKTGIELMTLFQELHRIEGQTVILVTHDPFIANHTNRIIRIIDGKIASDEINPEPVMAGTLRPEGAD